MVHSSSFIKCKKRIVLLLFFLLIGSVNGAWCFKIGADSAVPELELYDSHFVPAFCFTSEIIRNEDKSDTGPSDCHECLDLSFADIATGLQTGRVDYDLPSHLTNYVSNTHFVSHLEKQRTEFFFPDWPQRTGLNIHPAIPSTVLII